MYYILIQNSPFLNIFIILTNNRTFVFGSHSIWNLTRSVILFLVLHPHHITKSSRQMPLLMFLIIIKKKIKKSIIIVFRRFYLSLVRVLIIPRFIMMMTLNSSQIFLSMVFLREKIFGLSQKYILHNLSKTSLLNFENSLPRCLVVVIPISENDLSNNDNINIHLEIPVKVGLFLNYLNDRITNPNTEMKYRNEVLSGDFTFHH